MRCLSLLWCSVSFAICSLSCFKFVYVSAIFFKFPCFSQVVFTFRCFSTIWLNFPDLYFLPWREALVSCPVSCPGRRPWFHARFHARFHTRFHTHPHSPCNYIILYAFGRLPLVLPVYKLLFLEWDIIVPCCMLQGLYLYWCCVRCSYFSLTVFTFL